MKEGHQLLRIRTRPGIKSALVFLHGFRGDSDDTWNRFPTLLGTELSLQRWDIFSLGYNTSFLPGTRGLWAADPEIPILAARFRTEMGIAPLYGYQTLAIAAHSMGGLIAQQALVEDSALSTRVGHLFLFGTPSAGLRKASIIARLLGPFVGVQVHNMGEGDDFIRNLRSRWSQSFGDHPRFHLYAIAGDRDQFVPPASSLKPFAPEYHRVVTGDHLSIVNPRDRDADAVRLVVSALMQTQEPAAPSSPLRLAAETGSMAPHGLAIAEEALVGSHEFHREEEVVQAALVLDRDGKRPEAIALLEKYHHLGTDAKGTLAGRIKRRWMQEGNEGDAHWALGLYEQALGIAGAAPESSRKHSQMFYHAINIAFMKFVAFDNLKDAQEMAKTALDHVNVSPPDIWSVSTAAEAYLYLGEHERSLEKYREAVGMNAERWQLVSAGQQAQCVVAKFADATLQESIKEIFDPKPKRLNRIFVSYSHRDSEWLDELKTMLNPFLTDPDELELWTDAKIREGSMWLDEIRKALATCRVAVLLVSSEFLASEFIRKEELPEIVRAVDQGQVHLVWLYLSPALYEVTVLRQYQAAHDVGRPLESLEKVEQRQVLKDVAFKIKAAVFA
jgi:pimeloyl-ACP methyl ester carboxylesterase